MELLLVVFVFGLFIGSFLNVLIDRLPREESFLKGRSHCEKCKKALMWRDLIPLFSYIFLKGKCRYCSASLSLYYLIVELTTGVMFVVTTFFVFSNFQFSIFNFQLLIPLIYYLFMVSSLIVIFFADLKYGIIPDKIIFTAIVVTIGYLLFNSQFPASPAGGSTLNYLLSAFGASLFFLLLFFITKGRGMGLGDVKLSFLMGLILGFPNIVVTLYLAFLTGAIAGVILVVWRKKRLFGDALPFGPFLSASTLVSLFFADVLINQVLPWLNF